MYGDTLNEGSCSREDSFYIYAILMQKILARSIQ